MRKLLLAILLALPTVSFADVKVGGFVELAFDSVANKDTAGKDLNTGLKKSGFTFADGAVYLSGGTDKTSFMVDIPVSSNSNTANWQLGQTKGQAYVKMNHGALSYRVGQWDGIWGFEANDAKDRFFSHAGIVKTQMHSTTHLGLAVNYMMDAWSFDAYTANTNQQGNVADSGNDTQDGGSEYGLKAGWMNDMFRVSVGTSTRGGQENSTTGKTGTHTTMAVLAGVTFAGVTVDLDYASNKSPVKVATEDTATGMGLHVGYHLNDTMSLGLRYESLDGKLTNGLSNYEEKNTTLGVHHKCDDNLAMGFNYSMATMKATKGADDSKKNTITLATTYTF